MENYPKTVKDDDLKQFIEFARRNAMGNVVIATDTPTLDTLKPNSITVFGSDVYIKFNNATGIKLTGTALS
jgi:hypothetical protein